jgi:uncharacterized membrane protein YgdD (TMEM256/DUF423 family)
MSGVALGAFGAHGLAQLLAAHDRAGTYQTAVQYHLIHALALLAVAWLSTVMVEAGPRRLIQAAGWLFTAGIVVFSGSLYLLALLNLGFLGAIAPVGGAAFIAGWGCLAWAAWRTPAR